MWPAATGACLIAGCEEVCKYQNRHLHAGSGKCEGSLAGLGAEDHRPFARSFYADEGIEGLPAAASSQIGQMDAKTVISLAQR